MGAIIFLIVHFKLAAVYPILWLILLIILVIFLFIWLDNAAFGEEYFNIIMLFVLQLVLLYFAYRVYPEGITDKTFANLTIGEWRRLLIVIILVIGFIADFCFTLRYMYKTFLK